MGWSPRQSMPPPNHPTRFPRRTLLTGCASTFLLCCRRDVSPGNAGLWRELAFEPSADAPDGQRALLLVSERDAPLLVALHGRGESGRGLDVGARGWRDDYALERAH